MSIDSTWKIVDCKNFLTKTISIYDNVMTNEMLFNILMSGKQLMIWYRRNRKSIQINYRFDRKKNVKKWIKIEINMTYSTNFSTFRHLTSQINIITHDKHAIYCLFYNQNNLKSLQFRHFCYCNLSTISTCFRFRILFYIFYFIQIIWFFMFCSRDLNRVICDLKHQMK